MILTAPAEAFTDVREIPLDELVPFAQNPRSDLGDLTGLAQSIDAVGIIEPLVVAANGPHGYTVVAGHRRLAAARQAGLTTVPCIHRGFSSTAEMIELTAIENLQREGLTPLDEARAMQALVDLGKTQREIAERIGCNQSHVSRRLSLLELEEPDLDRLRSGTITVREAEQIARPPAQPAVDPILPPTGNLVPPRPKPRPESTPTNIRPETNTSDRNAKLPKPIVSSDHGLEWQRSLNDCTLTVSVRGNNAALISSTLDWIIDTITQQIAEERGFEAPDAAEVQAEVAAITTVNCAHCKWSVAEAEPSRAHYLMEAHHVQNHQADYPDINDSHVDGSPHEDGDGCVEEGEIDHRAEQIHGDVVFESPDKLQRSPWPGYRAAKDEALLAKIGRIKDRELARHVVAYEWGGKNLRRDFVLAAALARLDELAVGE